MGKGTVLFLLILAGAGLLLLLPLMTRKQPGGTAATYKNTEEWEISWNSEGLPVKVIVHRKATQDG